MQTKRIKNNITDDVADTLYIPLAMKRKETNRKNAFFRDIYACELLEKINYDFSKYDKAVRSSIGVAIRAMYFDQVTTEFIINNVNPIVVHVGCGLDTRFLRIGKNITDKSVFYEVDLPEVINLRKLLIPETKNNPYLSASMFETQWLDDIKSKHPDSPILFLIEGVLMYFENSKVEGVIRNISERFNKGLLVFDAVNGWMCRNSHRHDTVKLTKASFRFVCDNPKMIEKWGNNIHLQTVKHFNEFDAWKRAGLINCLIMKLVPVIRTACRMLVYRIGK